MQEKKGAGGARNEKDTESEDGVSGEIQLLLVCDATRS